VRYFEAVGNFDITDLLAKVSVPTLVMHVRGDLQNPFEAGRQMAAGIARALCGSAGPEPHPAVR
jgi:hypothetical protein